MSTQKIGRYAFLLGLAVSVIAGFVNVGYYGVLGLFALGVIVGVLNVTGKEVQSFLLGTIALMLVGTSLSLLSGIPGGDTLITIIQHFTAFVAGGALLVALREVYGITSTQ